MTADEMFEELGYKKEEANFGCDETEYIRYDDGETYIEFMMASEYITIDNIISIRELKAINTKVKELGWE